MRSHQKAMAAIQAGKFDDETVPVPVSFTSRTGRSRNGRKSFSKSTRVRAQTLRLRPWLAQACVSRQRHGDCRQFVADVRRRGGGRCHVGGTGAGLGIKPLARFVSFATAGYKPEEMGLGPVFAIPKALKLAGLKLSDIDVIELNEAFAAQSLAVIQEAGLDPERVNPNGGAVASGTSAGLHRCEANGDHHSRNEAA